MSGVMRRKQQMVDGLMELHSWLFNQSGAEPAPATCCRGHFVDD